MNSKMLALLAATTLRLAHQSVPAPGSPIDVPCHFYYSIPIVQLSIDQKPYQFAVDTGNPRSYITPAASSAILQADKDASLTLGTASLPVEKLDQLTPIEQQGLPNVDGYLGRDVLGKLIFGIDYQVGKFYVWPNSGNVSDWVKAIGLGEADTPFDGTEDVPFCIVSPYGRLAVDTGAPTLLLNKDSQGAKAFIPTGITFNQNIFDRSIGKVEIEVIPKVDGIGSVLDNMPAIVARDETMPYGAIGGALLGPRLVIDGPQGRMYKTVDQDPDYEMWLAMSLLMPNVKVISDKIYVPIDAATAKQIGLASDPWAELASYNDVDMSDLLVSYSHHDPAGSQMLLKCLTGLTKKSRAEFVINGQTLTAYVDPVYGK